MKLVKRTEIEKPVETFNLHISKNHNYVANGIVVSNCHGTKAPVIRELLIKYGKNIPYRFGVTGTLPKEKSDALGVHTALGPKRYEIKAHQLISDGHLANLYIEIDQLKVDLNSEYNQYLDDYPVAPVSSYAKFRNKYFHDWTNEKNYLHSLEDRTNWITNKIEERRSGGKGNTLVLVNGIKYGKKLAKMIDNAIFLHGKDKMVVRQDAYNLFKEGDDVVVIATIQIASTGLDIPRIFNLFYIDVGKSFIRTIQTIGRGLRKAHDKEHVNVFDICADTTFSKRHLSERIKYYKDALYPHSKITIENY